MAKLLLVESDGELAPALAELLDPSHDVHVSFDGEEALEVANRERPDVAVIDHVLHGRPGYVIAAEMRRNRRLGGMNIIGYSGFREDDEDYWLDLDAGYLEIPFSIEKLETALRDIGRRVVEIAWRPHVSRVVSDYVRRHSMGDESVTKNGRSNVIDWRGAVNKVMKSHDEIQRELRGKHRGVSSSEVVERQVTEAFLARDYRYVHGRLTRNY